MTIRLLNELENTSKEKLDTSKFITLEDKLLVKSDFYTRTCHLETLKCIETYWTLNLGHLGYLKYTLITGKNS